jgi:hypothetical protein
MTLYKIHRGSLLKTLGLPKKIPDYVHVEQRRVPVSDRPPFYPLGYGKVWGYVHIMIHTGGNPGKKSSAHRIMVQCPCGREVPFGRMHQHGPACKKFQLYIESLEKACVLLGSSMENLDKIDPPGLVSDVIVDNGGEAHWWYAPPA